MFFYCPVSMQERKEEAKTSKRDRRKGSSNSDLVMKRCERKLYF